MAEQEWYGILVPATHTQTMCRVLQNETRVREEGAQNVGCVHRLYGSTYAQAGLQKYPFMNDRLFFVST